MSELFPTKSIALVYTSCSDSTREYEFNHWYNKVHIPNLVQTPGIVNVYRYRNMKPELKEGQFRYLDLYRIESDDPWDLMQRAIQWEEKKRVDQGQMIDCIQIHRVTVWDFIAYRRTVSPLPHPGINLPDGMPEAMLVVPTICTDPAREDEFNDWYLHTHFHDLLEIPGLVQAHRYRSLNPKPEDDEARYLALYEIISDDPFEVVRGIFRGDRDIRIPQGRMIDCIQAPYGMGTYQHIDL